MKRMFILLFVSALVLSSSVLRAEVPDGGKGFAGMVTGKVVSKGDDKITIEVTAIAKTWKHSKAENAKALVGKKVEIRIIPTTYQGKSGDYLALVRKFFSLLQVGETDSFDVRHVEGDWLKFMELTEAQRKRVAVAEVPDGAKGFAGMVTGKVVSKGDDKITIEVTAIAKTWKHSKAENPKALVGKKVEIRIIPTTYEGKSGDYLALVRKFFSLLQVGETDSFDVRHVEGDWLKFMELTEAQRKRAEEAK